MLVKKRFSWVNISRVSNAEFGIYAFWTKRFCVYVGLAKKQGFRTRLMQHYRGSHNEKLNLWLQSSVDIYFSTEVIEDFSTIETMEKLRIKQYSPLTNILLNS